MSDLAKLARQPQKVEVLGHEITLMPLGTSDLGLFEKETKTKEEALKTVKAVIMKSIEGATDEEYAKMSLEYMLALQDAIGKVNNIDEDTIKEKSKLLKDIKAEQDAQSA